MSDKTKDVDLIRAEAEAKAKVLEARAKLNPIAQVIYALLDGMGNFINGLGCLLIIAIVVIAILAPEIFGYLLGK